MNSAAESLTMVKHVLQAARNTKHRSSGAYVDGINAGLDIALRAVEMELRFANDVQPEAEAVTQ